MSAPESDAGALPRALREAEVVLVLVRRSDATLGLKARAVSEALR